MNSILFYSTLLCLVADSVFGLSLLPNNSSGFGLFKSENTSLWNPFKALESGIKSMVFEADNTSNTSQPLLQPANELCRDLVDKYKNVDRKDGREGCTFKVEANPMNGTQELNVTLYSFENATFNEFMVQPRQCDDHKELVPGDFTAILESQVINCSTENYNNTLVQNSTDPKSYVNGIWKPRINVSSLKIVFYATVYVDGDVICDQIISEDITVTSSPEMHHS